jgi:hypothetical protein
MFRFLGGDLSERKLRLFACACCRRLWDDFEGYEGGLGPEWGRAMIEMFRRPLLVAEAYADSQASESEMLEAGGWRNDFGGWADEGPEFAYIACTGDAEELRGITAQVLYHGSNLDAKQERKVQASLLRDVFGNPFRPVVFDPGWRTPAVVSLAEAAYEERSLPAGTLIPSRLAVLSDALEEAGCTNADLLGHLRSPGPHVRGCWAVDLVRAAQ